ncbi:MAG TPA: phospholipase D-like domain-containing protein, partial [Isosphaeraceae bacterium]|nr:phospholipase D-like domain-containing protein [Isosphaeraceae bacterium]
MKTILPVLLSLLLTSPALAGPGIQVCFTPEYNTTQECTQEIVNAIDSAGQSILVQAYSFTSAPIAKALVDAHRRGVDVRVILDARANGGRYSEATFLKHAEIPVLIDSQHSIAHNKVIVIDGRQ